VVRECVTVQTFILSFSFAFAQSIAKSVSRCTTARKTFSAGSWPAIEAAGKEDKRWSNALWDLQNFNG
jgi:hypothetical protein